MGADLGHQRCELEDLHGEDRDPGALRPQLRLAGQGWLVTFDRALTEEAAHSGRLSSFVIRCDPGSDVSKRSAWPVCPQAAVPRDIGALECVHLLRDESVHDREW